jgi:hypothetical protein
MTRATVDLAEFPAKQVYLNAAGRAQAAAMMAALRPSRNAGAGSRQAAVSVADDDAVSAHTGLQSQPVSVRPELLTSGLLQHRAVLSCTVPSSQSSTPNDTALTPEPWRSSTSLDTTASSLCHDANPVLARAIAVCSSSRVTMAERWVGEEHGNGVVLAALTAVHRHCAHRLHRA